MRASEMDFVPYQPDRRAFLRAAGIAASSLACAGRSAASVGAEPLQSNPSSAPHGSNQARLLTDDSTSLLHRLDMIDAAQREILLAAYEVGDDDVALCILARLRQAADRGVRVRLIVDGHGQNNLIPKPMMAHLIERGVCLREHMPDVRYKLEIGRQRMHDKLLIVDRQRMIIGGRNVRADYYGMVDSSKDTREQRQKNRIDREAYVVGPISPVAADYFCARWNASTSGQPSLDREEKKKTIEAQRLDYLNSMAPERAKRCASEILDQALACGLALPEPCCHHHTATCDCEHFFELSCVRFLHDIPEHAKDCPQAIAAQLDGALAAARHTVLLETPYLVFTRQLRHRLVELSRSGVAVAILTNSLETNDQAITHAQYANERKWMLAAGIELWEIKGCRHLHAKSMVIDGCRVMVGSYNFDVLSETRNAETALLIDDPEFAAAVTREIGRHMQCAVKVETPLIGFDARTNDVESDVLRDARVKRLISPWIKKYL